MGRRQSSDGNSSVIGHITVYKYGKLFSPMVPQKCRKANKVQGSKTFDRPGLISKIHHLLEVHRTKRTENARGNTRCSSNMHNALLKVIRLCYEQKICDSKLYPVGDLFLELFICSGNSYAIFSILLDGHMTLTSQLMNTGVNILYPDHVHSDNKTSFEYYLHHISNIKRFDGDTYLDYVNHEIDKHSGTTPLAAAVQKRDPILVLTLLRYGADPFLSSDDTSFDYRTQNPTEQVIDDLNGLFLFKNTDFSPETRAKLATEESKMWEILSYFRRAVPGIPLTSTNHIVTTTSENEVEQDCVEYVDDRCLAKQMYGIHPRIAETIDFDFFKPTLSLKHLCRCSIRDSLKKNRFIATSIPKGISALPLPTKLKRFLDLQED